MRARGPVVCVVGPTASGKSALAELVAERLASSVVSVDAMQVYRGMDIGTAKTPPASRRVPLLMVDVADPAQNYSARLFQTAARGCVDVRDRDDLVLLAHVPLLCSYRKTVNLVLNTVLRGTTLPS